MTISASRRMQAVLHRRPALRLTGLLAPALAWLGVFYLVPLGFLLATAFFDTDSFTGRITYELSPDNVVDVLTTPAYLFTALRTVAVAVGVTLLCVLLALPLAGFMALVARARARPVLVALVLTPLWASYLVKVYAWRILLAPEGPFGAGYGWVGVVLTLTYLWLPYMVLPVYAGIDSMRAASWRRPRTSGPARGRRSAPWWPRCWRRPSRPVRCSPSRCRWATTSPCSWSAAPTRCWATWCTPTSPPICRSRPRWRCSRCW